jgi:hypothetical protein
MNKRGNEPVPAPFRKLDKALHIPARLQGLNRTDADCLKKIPDIVAQYAVLITETPVYLFFTRRSSRGGTEDRDFYNKFCRIGFGKGHNNSKKIARFNDFTGINKKNFAGNRRRGTPDKEHIIGRAQEGALKNPAQKQGRGRGRTEAGKQDEK